MHQKYSAWAKMFQEFNCGVEKLFDRLETLVLQKNKKIKMLGGVFQRNMSQGWTFLARWIILPPKNMFLS